MIDVQEQLKQRQKEQDETPRWMLVCVGYFWPAAF
jgi:hypothetical protein